MTQGRLVSLAIMSIESDILREIDFTAIISNFAVAKSRKVSGLWLLTFEFVLDFLSCSYMHDSYTDNNMIIILIFNNACSYLLVLYF